MTQVRFFTSKKSDEKYARRCKIEDFTGHGRVRDVADDYERFAEMFADDKIVLAQGKLERNEYAEEPILVLSKLLTLDQAKRELTTALLLKMTLQEHRPEQVDTLAKILKRTPDRAACKCS